VSRSVDGQVAPQKRWELLEALRQLRTTSRSALARETHTSRGMVSLIVDEFLREGLVREEGRGNSTGGRPPRLVSFCPDAVLAAGAALSDAHWALVLVNLDAQVVRRIESPLSGPTPGDAVEALETGYRAISRALGAARLLPAVGLGTPGLVDIRSGEIVTAADRGWANVPMASMVAEKLGLPSVIMANRSRVGALAEVWQGAGRGLEDLIYVWVGSGIAAGIVHKGRLYVGANSSAGELGHVTVRPDGPLCGCGNRGCLQQLASGPAIADAARRRLRETPASLIAEMVSDHPERITAQTVFAAAEGGDATAQELLAQAGSYLGLAIGNLVNLFNPQMVVLGGPVGSSSDLLLHAVQAEVRRRAMTYPLSAAAIRRSELGAEASAIGAGVLVLQRTLGLLRESAQEGA